MRRCPGRSALDVVITASCAFPCPTHRTVTGGSDFSHTHFTDEETESGTVGQVIRPVVGFELGGGVLNFRVKGQDPGCSQPSCRLPPPPSFPPTPAPTPPGPGHVHSARLREPLPCPGLCEENKRPVFRENKGERTEGGQHSEESSWRWWLLLLRRWDEAVCGPRERQASSRPSRVVGRLRPLGLVEDQDSGPRSRMLLSLQ